MNTKEKLVYGILSKYAKKKGLVKYAYPDGFYVFGNPDSQELADKKHKEWLESKKGE
jgi:prophage tail gpP-like protein